MIHNVAALLHKMNDDINKVCQKTSVGFVVWCELGLGIYMAF